MTETGIVALAGVVATLLSGLGAAWLTNKSARQRELEQRATVLQAELRALIVEILVAARGMGGATSGLSAGLAFASSKDQFQKSLVDLLNNSQPGKDFARHGGELHTLLTDARLRLPVGSLADAIDEMNQLMLRWWEDVINPMSDDLKGDHPDVDRRMQMSIRYTKQWTSMIKTLEATAREELPRIAESQRVGTMKRASNRETRNYRT